jgi:hypothetical protein
MIFMAASHGGQLRYLGRNGSFGQALAVAGGALRPSGSGVDSAVIFGTENDGKIKGPTPVGRMWLVSLVFSGLNTTTLISLSREISTNSTAKRIAPALFDGERRGLIKLP